MSLRRARSSHAAIGLSQPHLVGEQRPLAEGEMQHAFALVRQ